MSYQYELHCHTAPVSRCAETSPEEAARLYIEAGYDGVVVTDHMNRYTFRALPDGMSWEEQVAHFLSGWRRFREAAGEKLTVLLGMELRFDENDNDYLVYGIDEEFLFAYPDLMEMRPVSFSFLARENGLLFYQAHPFRDGMTVVYPELLDGIESYNGHPGHESRNDIASIWARKYDLLQISGSDFHFPDACGCGGIRTEKPIRDNRDLIAALRARPQLIRR